MSALPKTLLEIAGAPRHPSPLAASSRPGAETAMIARVAPILAAVALLLAGNGLLGAALPGRWLEDGIDPKTIAALGSANYFGVLLGAVFGIALVARLGSGRATGLFALLFTGSTLALAVASAPGPLALLRLTGGFGLAGLTLLIENGLNTRAAPGERGRLLAIYMVVFTLAQATGAVLSGPAGGGAGPGGGRVSAVGAAAGRGRHRRSRRHQRHCRLRQSDQPCTTRHAGRLLGGGAARHLLRPGASRRPRGPRRLHGAADRHGPMPVLVAVNPGAALASAWLVAGCWSGEPASLAAAFAFGLAGFSCYPLPSMALNRMVTPEARLAANGRLILVSCLGGCLGPLAAAALTPGCGPAAGFVVIGTGAAITTALIALPQSFFNRSEEPAPDNHDAITMLSSPFRLHDRVRTSIQPLRSRPCLRPVPSPSVRPRGKTSW